MGQGNHHPPDDHTPMFSVPSLINDMRDHYELSDPPKRAALIISVSEFPALIARPRAFAEKDARRIE